MYLMIGTSVHVVNLFLVLDVECRECMKFFKLCSLLRDGMRDVY